MRLIEKLDQDVRLLLPPVQPLSGRRFQRLAITRTGLSDDPLDVAIEHFVGIEIGRISRQKEALNVCGVRFEPLRRQRGAVHRMAVDDQEDFAPRLFDQASQKAIKAGA